MGEEKGVNLNKEWTGVPPKSHATQQGREKKRQYSQHRSGNTVGQISFQSTVSSQTAEVGLQQKTELRSER